MTSSQPPKDGRRRPAAFSFSEEPAAKTTAEPRAPRSFDSGITITPDEEDPFLTPPELEEAAAVTAVPRPRRGLSLGGIALAGIGTFISLALGLWADRVLRDLFARADWLGYVGLALLGLGLAALLTIVAREVFGMMRLAAVQSLKAEAEAAALAPQPEPARAVIAKLTALVARRPETASGRAALKATEDEILDAPGLIALAERELLTPLDRKARALILGASQRVSIVTAISPRAIVDLAYVLFEVSRLVRAMAELYGGRPGTLGMIRLMRDVLAHLAVTGSIALGDGLAQQVLGQGLASRLSTRLGEGVINGLLTARIGIAAMDLCRPLPFSALKRPGIGDFMSDIAGGGKKDA